MGSNNSQPQQNNVAPPPPSNNSQQIYGGAGPQQPNPYQYAHLTTNQQNQNILNQIYSNNTLSAASY